MKFVLCVWVFSGVWARGKAAMHAVAVAATCRTLFRNHSPKFSAEDPEKPCWVSWTAQVSISVSINAGGEHSSQHNQVH